MNQLIRRITGFRIAAAGVLIGIFGILFHQDGAFDIGSVLFISGWILSIVGFLIHAGFVMKHFSDSKTIKDVVDRSLGRGKEPQGDSRKGPRVKETRGRDTGS